MTPLFDAYVMVDWSAAAVPRLGKDSIWICHLRRNGTELGPARLENIPTRHEARERLHALLRAEHAAGRAVLVGFDFAFGYPTGLAKRLGLAGPPWRGMWDLLSEKLQDAPDNRNNRFAVASQLNQRISGGEGPFWGCPASETWPCLGSRHHRSHEALGLAERRIADGWIRGPQPVWKLAYAGSVGSQSLTGIPVLRWLRDHPDLSAAVSVWPFETGLRPLTRADTDGRIVLAEIYPSLIEVVPRDDETRDELQVRTMVDYFAECDDAGELASLFAGDPSLDAEQRRRIESEESWILGVPMRTAAPATGARTSGRTAPHFAYLREPEAIYRESQKRIEENIDLARFPAELRATVSRLVHATAEPAIADDLVWSEGVIAAGRAALDAGAPILVDAEMVAAGVISRLLPAQNPVLCFIRDRRVPALARRLRTTRSAAAIELWRPRLAGAIVAIGNAPTALFHLLEMIAAGAPLPALVLGFPVGFVGAAEAKAALAENRFGLPFIALGGRRGGSALAAAAVNALASDGTAP
jgi:precorrin-8X/cobalt-precorrin-8 methylmutase